MASTTEIEKIIKVGSKAAAGVGVIGVPQQTFLLWLLFGVQ